MCERDIQELSVTYAQFCCEPKTPLKENKSLFKKKPQLPLGWVERMCGGRGDTKMTTEW